MPNPKIDYPVMEGLITDLLKASETQLPVSRIYLQIADQLSDAVSLGHVEHCVRDMYRGGLLRRYRKPGSGYPYKYVWAASRPDYGWLYQPGANERANVARSTRITRTAKACIKNSKLSEFNRLLSAARS